MFDKELFDKLTGKYNDAQDDDTFVFSEQVKRWYKYPDEFVEWIGYRKLHWYQKIWIRLKYRNGLKK